MDIMSKEAQEALQSLTQESMMASEFHAALYHLVRTHKLVQTHDIGLPMLIDLLNRLSPLFPENDPALWTEKIVIGQVITIVDDWRREWQETTKRVNR